MSNVPDSTTIQNYLDCISMNSICQYLDNTSDTFFNFNGIGQNDYPFDPTILYNFLGGGLYSALKDVVRQYDERSDDLSMIDSIFQPVVYIYDYLIPGTPITKVINVFRKVTENDTKSRFTIPGSVFIGTYTNNLKVNSCVNCDFDKRIVYVTFSGTNGLLDLIVDGTIVPVTMTEYDEGSGIKVHRGMYRQMKHNGFAYQLANTVLNTIKRGYGIDVNKNTEWTIQIFGYSLGACEAMIFLLFLNSQVHAFNKSNHSSINGNTSINITIKLTIYGTPPFANRPFNTELLRIIREGSERSIVKSNEVSSSNTTAESFTFNIIGNGTFNMIHSDKDPITHIKENIIDFGLGSLPITKKRMNDLAIYLQNMIIGEEYVSIIPQLNADTKIEKCISIIDSTTTGDVNCLGKDGYTPVLLDFYDKLTIGQSIKKNHMDVYFDYFRDNATNERPTDRTIESPDI